MRKPSRSNALTQQILYYLRLKKCKAWRNNNGGIWDPTKKIFRANSSTPGISDIAGILPGGRALYIEVKVGKDKLSPDQVEFLDDVNKMGGLAFEARSVDDVIEKIK